MDYSVRNWVNQRGEEVPPLDDIIKEAEIIRNRQIPQKTTSPPEGETQEKDEPNTKPLGTREVWSKNMQRKKQER